MKIRSVIGKLLFFTMGCIGSANSLTAQELDCKFQINHEQIQGTNVQVFETLQTAITEFMNERRWTQAQYAVNERIRCSLNLTLKSYDESEGRFEGELTIQSTRPVYYSSYQTTVFLFKDANVGFNYREFDPLELRDNQVDNNLTAILAYYAYLIIGLDMDTMAPLGGTEILRAAESIVTGAQTLGENGWKPFDDSKNRYAIITDYLEESMSPLRQLMYTYHRTGMDEMVTNANRARASITAALPMLKQARDNKPMTAWITLFTEIKRDEIINLYGPASQSEKETIYNLMSSLNPSLNSDWEKIKEKQP